MTSLPQLKTMTSEIAVADVAAVLDLSGAMYLPDHDALIVADLHFEKGSSFARRGDSFHDLDGPDRLVEDDRAALARLQAGRNWIWITGNHDRTLPPSIGGEVVEELALGALVLRHEPEAGAA